MGMIKREELKRLRESKRLSQAALARLAECSQQAIAAIETGKQKQSGYVFAIARVLECPLSDLETEVQPISGLLYVMAEELGKLDDAVAERFLRRAMDSLKDLTISHPPKIARLPVRSKATSKRRRPSL